MDKLSDALAIFHAGVQAVQPHTLLPRVLSADSTGISIGDHHFPRSSFRHLYLIGAGKAAAAMAVTVENILGDWMDDGVVVTKYGHGLPLHKIRVLEAAHPVPDENGAEGVRQTLQLLDKVTQEDILICLLSGGASALWCDLPEGISIRDMQITADILVRSGADIREMNTVRKKLSTLKGGQLIRHCAGARVFCLAISDVPGNDISDIGSGPAAGDASSFGDAVQILKSHGCYDQLPSRIRARLQAGAAGILDDNPPPGDPVFDRTVNRVIGSNGMALQAAAAKARALGYQTEINPVGITGNTETEAERLVQLALTYQGPRPFCYLQGGETTVRVTGNGKGGRNQHFALAALLSMQRQGLHEKTGGKLLVLSAGTDGTDGPTDAAGAWATNETLAVAVSLGLSPQVYFDNQDAYHFLRQTGNLIRTGPTQTNVMDIMMAIIA